MKYIEEYSYDPDGGLVREVGRGIGFLICFALIAYALLLLCEG